MFLSKLTIRLLSINYWTQNRQASCWTCFLDPDWAVDRIYYTQASIIIIAGDADDDLK